MLNATTCRKHQAALSRAYVGGLRVADVASLKASAELNREVTPPPA